MRAHTPAGILLKLRVGEAWAMDEDFGQNEENLVRASIKAGLMALAEKAGAALPGSA